MNFGNNDAEREARLEERMKSVARSELRRLERLPQGSPEFDPDDYEELREIVESEGGEA